MSRTRLLAVARPSSLGALTILLLAPGLWLGPTLDAAVFMLVGARMRGGEMPYRDIWDHKPPGVYVAEWIGQTALPWLDPWLVAWLLSAVCSVVAVLVLYALMARRFSPAAAWTWGLVGVVGVACYPIALGGGLTETFALLPLAAAWWLAIALRPGLRASAGVGLLLAVACLISLQAAAPAVAVAVAAVIRDRDPRATLWRAAGVVAGAALPAALTLAWLAAGGALGDAVDQILTYNAAYRAGASSPAQLWLIVALMLLGLAGPAVVGAVRVLRGRGGTGALGASALLWVVGDAAYIGYQGRMYLHYLVLLVPALVVLAAFGLAGVVDGLRAPDRGARYRAATLLGIACAVMLLSALVTVQVGGVVVSRAADEPSAEQDAAAWTRAHTCASATLFVWGNDAGLYLDSDRPPYDRYVYLFPMVTQGYWSSERTAETLARWETVPPQVVIETASAVPLFRPAAESGDARTFDSLAPLRDFVRAHYRLAGSFGQGENFRDVYVYEPPSC